MGRSVPRSLCCERFNGGGNIILGLKSQLVGSQDLGYGSQRKQNASWTGMLWPLPNSFRIQIHFFNLPLIYSENMECTVTMSQGNGGSSSTIVTDASMRVAR